jgi:hypothetical protein
VRGYEEAAKYVVAHTQRSPTCLFDSYLNGDFIYGVRCHDPARRLWVLRGDKLFFTVQSDPHAGYAEHVSTEDDVLALIHRYDPELIVVEEPQVMWQLPAATLLRQTLTGHPERFPLETTIPVETNYLTPRNITLKIYRNVCPNEHPDRTVEVDVMGMHRTLQTILPAGAGR